MPMTIDLTAVTATSATFALGALAADGTVEIQISPRPDWGFCVCPIYSVARAAAATISSLNQRSTLFVRARARRASGAPETWSQPIALRTADGPARDVSPAAVMIDLAMLWRPERVVQWNASGAVNGFPASNLAIDAPNAWKCIDAANGQYVEARLSGAPIDTVAVLNTNVPESGTVTITAAPTQAGLASGVGRVALANAVPFRASPNLPGRMGYHGLFRFAPTAMPWWRVAFGGAKPASTLHVEHMLFGLNRVTKNHAVDKTETPQPLGTSARSRTGIPDRVNGLPMRKVEFDIAMLTEAQFETAYGDLYHFENDPFFVLPNSKAGAFLHDRMLYGNLSGSRVYNPNTPLFTRSFAVESII